MKRILTAALLIVVLTAGMALAKEWRSGGRKNRELHGREWRNKEEVRHGKQCNECPMGGMHAGRMMKHAGRLNADRMNVNEIPQEIREKFAEAQKIMIDLRTELGKNPIDREKALELHSKHRALMQEICDWRFTQMLDARTSR